MRIIDVDAFHELMFQRYCKNCNSQAHRMCHACWVMDMMNELEDAPTINPEDLRPKGKWEDKPTGRYRSWQTWCTNCGQRSGVGGNDKNRRKPFCPNCGAKMEE